jgi:hypothetical protein
MNREFGIGVVFNAERAGRDFTKTNAEPPCSRFTG